MGLHDRVLGACVKLWPAVGRQTLRNVPEYCLGGWELVMTLAFDECMKIVQTLSSIPFFFSSFFSFFFFVSQASSVSEDQRDFDCR